MKYKLHRLLFIILLLITSHPLIRAQIAGYSCDFENPEQNNEWTLNGGPFGPRCINRWYIDRAENNGGEQSLYISYDNGKTAGYISTSKGQVVSAYTLIDNLPADNYEIAFDWQALGLDEDALYVCWVPENVFSNSTNETSSLPSYLTDYAIRVGGRTSLNNSLWNSSYGSFRHDGTPHKLCFVWRNGTLGSISPAACVDNIMIIPLSSCRKPTSIAITPHDTVIGIKWDGKSDAYDIRIKSRQNGQWYEFPNHTSDTLTVSGIPEGTIEIYIRAHCDDFYSVWVSRIQFIYYPGLRCVDFLNINHNNCYYGSTKNPTTYQGKIDAGYDDENSRHTIHYLDYETDPRTNGALHTVSPYDIASVRLGNWLVSSEAERIEYEYTVADDEAAVLLLHYAVVLQLPNHPIERQPRFTLAVTDEKGRPLDTDGCTELDFSAGYGTGANEGWIQIGEEDDALVWKNWSTVGVNLDRYSGQKLKIILTTYDCEDGMHSGYAYFAMSCTAGRLQALSCGESTNNVFRAPDGFNYRWYKRITPDITVSTDQQLSLTQGDTATYCCDVIQKLNSDCYFTLTATALPRYPVAEAEYQTIVENCRNVVHFTDRSHIIFRQADQDIISPDDRCDSVIWNFGDGNTSRQWSPSHTFPYEGGTYHVTQRVFLAGVCDSIARYDITLPAMQIPRDTTHAIICHGESYPFADSDRTSTGHYSDTIVGGAANGCDSIHVLDLIVGEVYAVLDTAITCTDRLPYIFNGKELTATGTYTDTFPTIYHCDSIVTLHLTVNQSLDIDLPAVVDVCADDSAALIPYTIRSGATTTYGITFDNDIIADIDSAIPDDTSLSIPLPDQLQPGHYNMQIRFANADCGDVLHDATLNVMYPDTILVQRWNDVLAVRNYDYNGNYRFIAYQWYKNGVVQVGEIKSILYEPDGLNPDALYHVALTGIDGQTINTCTMQPTIFSDADIEVTPTIVFSNGNITLNSPASGDYRIWSITGILVSSGRILDGETTISAPDIPGTYLLEMSLPDGTCRTRKIMVGDYKSQL